MLKRNWNWRNNRLFCHIFVIGEISIGVRPAWLSQCSNCGKQKRYLQIFREVSGVFQQNFNGSKIVLSSSRGQANFWGLEASRPRPRTSKCVLEAKDVLEDSTSVKYGIFTLHHCHYRGRVVSASASQQSRKGWNHGQRRIAEYVRIWEWSCTMRFFLFLKNLALELGFGQRCQPER